jgi:hypothetical protein
METVRDVVPKGTRRAVYAVMDNDARNPMLSSLAYLSPVMRANNNIGNEFTSRSPMPIKYRHPARFHKQLVSTFKACCFAGRKNY